MEYEVYEMKDYFNLESYNTPLLKLKERPDMNGQLEIGDSMYSVRAIQDGNKRVGVRRIRR